MKSNVIKEVGIVGDGHHGCRNGSHHFRKFQKDYVMEYIIPYYVSQGITEIYELGDWFDTRRYTLALDLHWQINEMIPLLAKHGMTLHMLLGNHNLALRDQTHIHSLTALLNASLAQGFDCIKVYEEPTEVMVGDCPTLILPWICESNYEDTLKAIDESKAHMVLAHLELEGFLMTKGSLSSHGTICTSLFEKFEKVLTGHYHLESTKKLKSGTEIKYIGVPYHLNTGDSDSGLDNGIYKLNTLTMDLEFIPNDSSQSMFQTTTYDYEELESSDLVDKYLDVDYLSDTLGLAGSVIRVEVLNKDNTSHFKRFIACLRLIDCVNFTIQDLTSEVETVEQEVLESEWKSSALDVLVKKAESTEGIHHNKVVEMLKNAHQRCLDKSNLV